MNHQISALCIHVKDEYDTNIVNAINSISTIDKMTNFKLFSCSCDVIINNKHFGVFPIYEGKYSYGNMIVWDLLSLELVVDFPNLDKIFYIQNKNIPWYDNTRIPYSNWSRMFDHSRVNIITDNALIHEIFKLTWKEPIIIPDINGESLYEILR